MADETGIPPELTPEPTSTRREKPVIEGKIVSEDSRDPQLVGSASAEPDAAAAAHAEPADSASDSSPPHRARASLWPIAAAVVIGAAIAAGSSYLMTYFDSTSETVAALNKRSADVGKRLAALEQKPDAGMSLSEALKAQEKRLSAAEQATREALSKVEAALAAAEASKGTAAAAPAPREVDLAPVQGQIGDIERRLADIDQKLVMLAAPPPEPKSEMRLPEDKGVPGSQRSNAQAMVIVGEILAGKVERGSAYATELAALHNLGADKSKLAVLEPGAARGVPTSDVLAAQFAALSNSLLAVQPEKQAENSFFDRLMQNAGGLVRVRKIDETSGTDLPARIARINAALRAGSVDSALAQWDDLPAPAKDKSQAFAAAAKLRLESIAAARAIQTEAVAALGKTKS
jgi:hypothetical protein